MSRPFVCAAFDSMGSEREQNTIQHRQESAEFLYSDTGELVGFFKAQPDGPKLYTANPATYSELSEIIEAKKV